MYSYFRFFGSDVLLVGFVDLSYERWTPDFLKPAHTHELSWDEICVIGSKYRYIGGSLINPLRIRLLRMRYSAFSIYH